MRWLLVLCLLLSGCVRAVPPSLVPAREVPYRTSDGWEGRIRHFPADGPPVLLVHGMGANHYNWDYREEVSLAYYLQQAGWDVWVPELRGDPGATAPSRRARRSYTFDDHAVHDMPAIVEAVLGATGHEQLFWVGHSMGGMLLYTTLELRPELVRAGVAIASPGTFDHPNGAHRRLRGLGWTMEGRGMLPNRAMAAMMRPLGRANPLFGRLANRENLDWAVTKGMARHALIDLPRPMARQALTWLEEEEFLTVDGEPWLDEEPPDVPLLVMGASVDKVVPEADVRATCARYPRCTYLLLGTEGGFATDYGHVDPVVGATAKAEVYPRVLAFLEANR